MAHDDAIALAKKLQAIQWHLVIFFVDNDKIQSLDNALRMITQAQIQYKWVVREKLFCGRLKWSVLKFLTKEVVPENLLKIRRIHSKVNIAVWRKVKLVSYNSCHFVS